jgi:uncharacterized protein (TIGR02646 family)
MSSKGDDSSALAVSARATSALVKRSAVPAGLQYRDYRKYLRYDFMFSCAYCTMSEAEAQAIRFTIDHYEPRNARPDLQHEYENLMYSCDECNLRKGDRCPPSQARADGYRFFRPDQDLHQEHFEKSGLRLTARSNTGNYSVEALDLNRHSLLKLREIRGRLLECDRLVVEGVLGLRNFHIDQLPPSIKGAAVRAINQASVAADQFANNIDSLLHDYARSPLIDPDPAQESEAHAEERAAKLKQWQVLYPQIWRAPRRPRKKQRSRKKS